MNYLRQINSLVFKIFCKDNLFFQYAPNFSVFFHFSIVFLHDLLIFTAKLKVWTNLSKNCFFLMHMH